MVTWTETLAEAAGALFVAALIPFYMGLIHLTFLHFAAYSIAAAIALAGGECLRFGARGLTMSDFASDAGLWGLLVLVVGSLTYFLALVAL